MQFIREYTRTVWKYWYMLVPGFGLSVLGFLKDVCGVTLDPLPSWVLWLFGAGALIVAQVLASLDQWRRLKALEEPFYDMPILDVIDIASDLGWDWVGGWQYWDLQDALHAAAANGLICVWGRRHTTHPLYPMPPSLIAKDILQRSQLKLPHRMDGKMIWENAETTLLSTKPNEHFHDLQVCRDQILTWLKSKHAKQFIGKRVQDRRGGA